MTLTIPPMPDLLKCPIEISTGQLIVNLESWGKHGWAEAERLEGAYTHALIQCQANAKESDNLRAERDEARAGMDAAYMRGCEVGAKHFGEVERALRAQVKDLAEALGIVLERADQNKDLRGIGWVYIGRDDYKAARAALSRLASADLETTEP